MGRPKIADLPEGPRKIMDKMIEEASQIFVENIGVPTDQVSRVIADMIDMGLVKIELTGDIDDTSTWRVRIILTEEGKAWQ